MTDREHGRVPRYRTVILDVDSTLSRTEGIDWLAALRGNTLTREIEAVTNRAMRGEIRLEDVYASRLEAIRPTRAEIEALGQEYVRTAMPGAHAAVSALRGAGVHVIIVSGGIRQAVLVLGRWLAVADDDVHAVGLGFTQSGDYGGFDAESPLARSGGKPVLLRRLDVLRPVLAVGDGITDAELRTVNPPAVDALVAFTGVVARAPVVAAADFCIDNFSQLLPIVVP